MRLRFILGRVFSGLGHNMAMTISVVLVTFISLLFVGVGGLAQMQVAAMQKRMVRQGRSERIYVRSG